MQPKLSFGVEPIPPDAPLAARMRPQTLDEFIGQEEAVGPGSMLRGSLERGRLPSFILWGCLLYTSPGPRDRTRSR